jgi:hypothetical protein
MWFSDMSFEDSVASSPWPCTLPPGWSVEWVLSSASNEEGEDPSPASNEEGEDEGIAPNDALDMISEDEATANAVDENDTEREARRARNRARAVRRRRVNERM